VRHRVQPRLALRLISDGEFQTANRPRFEQRQAFDVYLAAGE
jgi:hypothetical protein